MKKNLKLSKQMLRDIEILKKKLESEKCLEIRNDIEEQIEMLATAIGDDIEYI